MVTGAKSKWNEGLGVQTTVGQTIMDLFPFGFLVDAYIARHALKFVRDQNDVPKSKEVEKAETFYRLAMSGEKKSQKYIDDRVAEILNEREFDTQKRKKEAIESWATKSFLSDMKCTPTQFKTKFIAPPFTPFDLFATVGILLRNSGAYHHIEGASRERDFEHKKSERILLSKRSEREHAVAIGEAWRDGWSLREPPATDAEGAIVPDLAGEIFESWCHILAAWSEPLFLPSPGSTAAPVWWKHAYKLLMISDRAGRDSGISKPKDREDETSDTPELGFDKIRKGGHWASFAASIIADDEEPQNERKFETLCEDLKLKNWRTLEWGTRNINTLSAANRDMVCVLPKLRTAQLGCTMRSLSHSLCLLPPRGFVRASWSSQYQGYDKLELHQRRPFNLLVVPFPYEIRAEQFHPVGGIDSDQKWGDFTFLSDTKFDARKNLEPLLKRAREEVGTVHGVVYPELSLNCNQFDDVFKYIKGETNVELLCAGLNQSYDVSKRGNVPPDCGGEQTNQAVMVAFERWSDKKLNEESMPYDRNHQITVHQKHHRWRLTKQQIIDYQLSSSLDPSITWWEDLRVRNRKLPIILMREKWAVTALICEDLARVDPAQEIVRAVGPNLVLSLLMDGPQIPDRWPSRYATILADDPGSSVLTVNSAGLIKRSVIERKRQKIVDEFPDELVIALWRDEQSGSVPIRMHEDDKAVCLTLYEYDIDEFTMDGRRNHHNSTSLRLGNYFSLR